MPGCMSGSRQESSQPRREQELGILGGCVQRGVCACACVCVCKEADRLPDAFDIENTIISQLEYLGKIA